MLIPLAASHTKISYFQGAILGLLQGIAEPFPISSLGHGVILPRLAGWHFQRADDDRFLTFLIATHLATAIVLLLFFERLRRRPPRPDDHLGDPDARIAKLSWRQAIAVGTSQSAGLVPGMSRSGVTMGGGLLVGLSNEDAARYAFLLATPIIGAAAALKLPDLLGTKGNGLRGPALVAGLCAAVTTFLAVKFLLKYFESNRLTPFGVYCICAGVIVSIVFAITG